jgi:hypothetical protein
MTQHIGAEEIVEKPTSADNSARHDDAYYLRADQ